MKNKLYIPYFLVIFCIVFAICFGQQETLLNKSSNEEVAAAIGNVHSVEQIDTSTVSPEASCYGSENVNVEKPLLTIESLQEYEQHIAQLNNLSDFVTYEMIQEFGEFIDFVCLSESRIGDYSCYMYMLQDNNGQNLYLSVNPLKKELTESINANASIVVGDDLRMCSSGRSGYLIHNNMQYYYVSGELLYISWVQGNLQFTLTGDGALGNYSVDQNTIFGKLIMGETVPTVFEAEK